MRAAEHERVDVGGLHRGEVLLGEREQLGACRDARLDELDEARGSGEGQLDVRVGDERLGIGARADRALRADHADAL